MASQAQPRRHPPLPSAVSLVSHRPAGGAVSPVRRRYAAAGWRDLSEGLLRWHMWGRMGWEDIRQRYRRSLLGPFWFSLSMLVMVVSLGVLYSKILHQDLKSYLPFLTLGLLFWGMMQDMIKEGCTAFIAAETLIRQIRLPLSTHIYRTICRQFLIFLHNLVIYIPVALLFQVRLSAATLLVLPGIVLWLVNAVWVELLLAMCSTRFRDVPPLVGSALQIVFFLSPILWHPATLGTRASLVEFNPVYHFLEIVRAPLMGLAPDPVSWLAVLGMTLVGWGITFPLFARFRSRIAYWL
jgi:ABC-type polysaccharide/polyol phosphate export permease